MKLKTVTVEFDMVVVVEDGQDAEKIARDHIEDAARYMLRWDFNVSVVDYKNGNATGWDNDCIPYGGDGDTTIAGILEDKREK